MRTTSKIISGVLVLALPILLVSVLGGTSSAASGTACQKITPLDVSSTAALTSAINTMSTDFLQQLNSVKTTQAAATETIAQNRSTAMLQFEQQVKALRSQSGLTSAQIAAINTYDKTMQQAETAREQAVDTARETYQTDLTNAVQAHQASLTSAAQTYRSTVGVAFMNAESICGSGSTALSSLKSGVRTARNAFSELQDTNSVKNQLKALASARDKAIQKANDTFTGASKDATNALAQVLRPANQ